MPMKENEITILVSSDYIVNMQTISNYIDPNEIIENNYAIGNVHSYTGDDNGRIIYPYGINKDLFMDISELAEAYICDMDLLELKYKHITITGVFKGKIIVKSTDDIKITIIFI